MIRAFASVSEGSHFLTVDFFCSYFLNILNNQNSALLMVVAAANLVGYLAFKV